MVQDAKASVATAVIYFAHHNLLAWLRISSKIKVLLATALYPPQITSHRKQWGYRLITVMDEKQQHSPWVIANEFRTCKCSN